MQVHYTRNGKFAGDTYAKPACMKKTRMAPNISHWVGEERAAGEVGLVEFRGGVKRLAGSIGKRTRLVLEFPYLEASSLTLAVRAVRSEAVSS